jgi:hypothetical protein
MDPKTRHDLKVLAGFIELYCQHRHPEVPDAPKAVMDLQGFDLPALAGHPLRLCPECEKLLAHAFVKRSRCPMQPKPACKHCPNHCYHPTYRARIQEVMQYSGKRLVLSGRLDYLFRLLF